MAEQLPAGAIRKTTGEIVIPATRRPDGTWRKEIRVREGYVPQDERGAFQTRAHQVRSSKPTHPPGWNPSMEQPAAKTTSQKRNEARKKKREEKAATKLSEQGPEEDGKVAEVTSALKAATISDSTAAEDKPDNNSTSSPEKQLRNLQKKLRNIEELEQKVAASGEAPTEEQSQKLQRKADIMAQIAQIQATMS